jgi:branched-chain amino acid transport system substrate-binding protein
MFKTYCAIIFISISFSLNSLSQTNSDTEANQTFNEAVTFFTRGDYYRALVSFNRILNDYSYNSKTTASAIFKGKALLVLNKLAEAKNTVIDFLNNYPSSKYIDEARILLSKIYLENGEYDKAFNQLLSIIQYSKSEIYTDEAERSGENLALRYLNIPELNSLRVSSKDEKIKSYLLLVAGKLQIDNSLYNDALASLNELKNLYPDSPYRSETDLLLSKISLGDTSGVDGTLLGVMLPLTGLSNEAISAAKEILEGIKFAVSEFNNGREDKIGLLIYDTGNDSEKIVSVHNQIINNSAVKMVIGPVFSNEVEITLEEFKLSGIPIVSPTATDNDLTLINDYFFQANPNFVIRAKVMAQYIFYVENKRKMAIFNSINGYSPLLAAEFANEFQNLGGEIIAKYTYRSGKLTSDALLDSARLAPAEGIYVPLSDKRDAPFLLSQLVQTNLDISIYGNQDWFLAKGFETSPELSNKITFTSDYFIDFNDIEFQNFNERFQSKTKTDVNRNVLYGYDTAKYILTVLRNIDRNRRNIKAKMETGISVNGFHNNISFDKDRINCFLNVVKYRDGVFELIDKFKAGN